MQSAAKSLIKLTARLFFINSGAVAAKMKKTAWAAQIILYFVFEVLSHPQASEVQTGFSESKKCMQKISLRFAYAIRTNKAAAKILNFGDARICRLSI